MNDLYDNLEDYNDVNVLEELRTENQDLKRKLEECTSTLGNIKKYVLQDYDNLALEFKKLEMNYSSLLKTARAEIERKTLMITNLNTEKDMIVLQSLQNGKDVRRKSWRDNKNVNRFNNKSNKQDNVKTAEKNQILHKVDNVTPEDTATPIIPVSENTSCPYKEPVTKLPIMNNKTLKTVLPVPDTCTDKDSEFKENLKQPVDAPKITASSIRNRRKSMPSFSVQEKYSSDKEEVTNETSKHTELPDNNVLPNNKLGQRILERLQSDRCSNKTSETSSTEERNFNYQDSIEPYRNRPNRYYERDNHRANKFESFNRYRKYSPDRGHRNPTRGYQDHHHRIEFGHRKIVESPQLDPYYNYQRRSRDHRPNFDRHHNEFDRYHMHHNEYNRNRFDDRQVFKHKMTHDYEEPSYKRQRIESNSEHLHLHEERRYDKEMGERSQYLKPHEHNIDHASCQSPDYIHTDVAPYPVKEIKHTAVMPLPDPREFSKRYIVNTDGEEQTKISTVIGRSIDIIPICKSAWNLKGFEMPQALKHNPCQTRDIVDEIDMDIGNTIIDVSMESGEINDTEKSLLDNYNSNREMGAARPHRELNNHTTENSKSRQDFKIGENVPTSSSTKYKIPKLGHNKSKPHEKESGIKPDPRKAVSKTSREYTNKREDINDSYRNTGRLIDSHDKVISNKITENSKVLSSKSTDSTHKQMTSSARAMIEGDLELSDEASDVGDLSNKTVKENQKLPLLDKDVFTASTNDNINKIQSILPHEKDRNLNSQEINPSVIEKALENDSKKHKGKKKRSKSRDSKETVDNIGMNHVPDKKTRSKREKEKPKEIEKKFTDLFGDTSSSLIMPEDLGITTFVPMFDDAQDAVDLNIKQITENPSLKGDAVCIENVLQTEFKGAKNVKPISGSESEFNVTSPYNKVCKDIISNDIEKSSKSIDENAPSPDVPLSVVYQNMNRETVVEDDNVVKMIVISTGVQPQFSSENSVPLIIEKPIHNIDKPAGVDVDVRQNLAINEFKKREGMKALATSTPQKEFVMKPSETGTSRSSCTSNIVRTDSLDSIPSAVDQYETNTLDLQTNADVPDVRIFVRRRRKIIKKPPAS